MPFVPAPVPEPAPVGAAQMEVAEVRERGSAGRRDRLTAEDSHMTYAKGRSKKGATSKATKAPAQASVELHLPTLGAAARVVAPTLGGALLGGVLFPAWVVGLVSGATLGLLAGVARNREVAKNSR